MFRMFCLIYSKYINYLYYIVINTPIIRERFVVRFGCIISSMSNHIDTFIQLYILELLLVATLQPIIKLFHSSLRHDWTNILVIISPIYFCVLSSICIAIIYQVRYVIQQCWIRFYSCLQKVRNMLSSSKTVNRYFCRF